jgi:iron complex transport system ATP-binding protein
VAELVATGRYPQQTGWAGQDASDRAAVMQALAATDTDSLADRHYSTLSGGERQRVLVASILAQEPDVLLLDEPTGSLDLHHRVQVFRLLRNAATGGRGVAVVTHDLNLAALFADRVALLVAGRLALVGPPGEVLGQDTLEQAYGAELVVLPHPDGVHVAVLPSRGDEP